MPIRVLLEDFASLKHRHIISRFCDELKANRQFLLREAARHRKRRQPAEISDSAKWIGKRELLVEIQVQRGSGHRQRSGRQHVVGIEELCHLSLQNLTQAQRGVVVRPGNRQIYVACDLSSGIR